MAFLHRVRAVVGCVPRSSARRIARESLVRIADCRKTQAETLSTLLALNAESDFSREHGLHGGLKSYALREQFPISGYETFAPAIERLKQGEHHALLGPENRLRMFSLSSGTTSNSKYIPITDHFVKGYRRGWNIWGINTLDAHPRVNRSTIFQMLSDYDRFKTPGGTPCGNISGFVAAMQKKIVRTMFTLPREVSGLENFDSKYYTTMRIGLLDSHVGMLTTANPSTLIHLARMVDDQKESLIRDIADGRVPSEHQLPDALKPALGKFLLKGNRRRAAELEAIVERTGRLYPVDFWPELSVIAVWTGGSARAYLPTLRRFYGHVPIRDHGLHASEGRMTIPLADGTPAGVLDTITHYFEFIPEAEYGKSNPIVLEAHELEEGQSYYILLTTASGLTRYDISDVVRCVGFYGTTPMLEFLHKGAHISNLTGEKISESQVVQAVSAASRALKFDPGQFTLTPCWQDPPYYRLLVEEDVFPSPVLVDTLGREVDRELKELNCEYDEKRDSGRLAPLKVETIPTGTWQAMIEKCQDRIGGSVEQYKHPCLAPQLKFYAESLAPLISELRERTIKVG